MRRRDPFSPVSLWYSAVVVDNVAVAMLVTLVRGAMGAYIREWCGIIKSGIGPNVVHGVRRVAVKLVLLNVGGLVVFHTNMFHRVAVAVSTVVRNGVDVCP